MKVLALHLPQFHRIPENDEWWGEGFTEWTNVRKAKPVYNGHKQPLTPLNNNYYDLTDRNTLIWQHLLASKYGISGFIYYHYWFNGKLLLQKPLELLLETPEANQEFCLCWANESWARTWDGKPGHILIEQTFGGESDWLAHIEYLYQFFSDDRYIKVDGKPMLFVYSASKIPEFDRMVEMWNKYLFTKGINGIYLVEFISSFNPVPSSTNSKAVLEFEPMFANRYLINAIEKAVRLFKKKTGGTDFLCYDRIWKLILDNNKTYQGRNIIKSAFTAWDNSPRKGRASTIIRGSSAEKFSDYLYRLLCSKRLDCDDAFLVINAWNEWGEGAILEPTEEERYRWLEAVEDALMRYEEHLSVDDSMYR